MEKPNVIRFRKKVYNQTVWTSNKNIDKTRRYIDIKVVI